MTIPADLSAAPAPATPQSPPAAPEGFLFNTLRREEIDVFQLLRVLLKVLQLHQTLVDQRAQAVVGFAQAHPLLAR